jgi:hypothetical protein
MLTAVCLRALGLATVTAAAATASADICDDYSREIDAHIAMLRTIEKRAAVVSNSEQAVEVINLYVDEMINWRRQMAPLDRAVYEMDQGNVENAPPLTSSLKRTWILQRDLVTYWSNTSAIRQLYQPGGECRTCQNIETATFQAACR